MKETSIRFSDGTRLKGELTDENQGIVEFNKMEYPLRHDQTSDLARSSQRTRTESGMKTSNTFNPRPDHQQRQGMSKGGQGLGGAHETFSFLR
jgi:hypothetical protein